MHEISLSSSPSLSLSITLPHPSPTARAGAVGAETRPAPFCTGMSMSAGIAATPSLKVVDRSRGFTWLDVVHYAAHLRKGHWHLLAVPWLSGAVRGVTEAVVARERASEHWPVGSWSGTERHWLHF